MNLKGSYNIYKIFFMKNNLASEESKSGEAPIVMADECGDSMWDAVLRHEVETSQVTKATHDPDALIDKIKMEQSVENNK